MNNVKPCGKSFTDKLFQPADNSPLVVFRILFGFLLCYHVTAYIINGAVYQNFIEPPFTFTYIGFEFLQPLPGNGMYFYFGLMSLLAILIMLGAWYRFAIISFALLWTIQYLMQKSGYNNHYYLILLLSWMMAFVPANRFYSIDVKRNALNKTQQCPQWTIWIFTAQMAIIYFYAAISKINIDWFSGKFLRIQFSRLSLHRMYGTVYGQEWFPEFIAYAGFFFDLLIIPLLLWKKSRPYAFILYCLFHLFNSFSFRIGIFPYLSIAMCVFFFDPRTIRSLFFKNKLMVKQVDENASLYALKRKWLIACLIIYFFIQLILPMRSWFYTGNTFWTEEGYRMSWKMMLRSKSGTIHFKVVDPTSGKTWIIDPKSSFAPIHVMWIAISPDITWQYAQRIKYDYLYYKYTNVKVYAISSVSLNRSEPLPLIDSSIDLSKVDWHPFKHSPWITTCKK